MNSIPSINITGNNVNFGHKVKYSPEALAEFTRQMDYHIGANPKKIKNSDFNLYFTINNYFYDICENARVPRWLGRIIDRFVK